MKKFTILVLALFLGLAAYSQPERHIVIEKVTGTWCQYCPRGVWLGDSIMDMHPNVTMIAIHAGDPMYMEGYYDSCGLTSFPTANIDRVKKSLSTGIWIEGVNVRMTETPEANVYVNTSFNPTTREVTATVSAKFFQNLSGDYRFNAIVVEDGVTGDNALYNQSNNFAGSTSYYGGFEKMPASIPYYMIAYDHVARAMLGGYYGKPNSLPTSINIGDSLHYTFTYTLPAEYDEDYVRVIAMLIKKSSGEIINSNKSPYLNGEENAAPFFIGEFEKNAYVNSEYDEIVYAHDPDNKNITITPSGTGVPSWLHWEIDNKSIRLHGTPLQVGTHPIEISVQDGEKVSKLIFTMTVHPAYPHNWQLVGTKTPSSDMAFSPDVAVNNNNSIFVSYTTYGTQLVKVFQLENGNWKQVGNTVDYQGNNTSIAVDNAGTPYILYNKYSDNTVKDLQVKKFNGSSWVSVGTIISPAPTSYIEIGFDNANVPHIVCQEGDNNAMMMKYNAATGYWDMVGYSFAYRGTYMKMSFDNKNNPHVFYCDIDNGYVPLVKKFKDDLWEVVGGANVDTSGVYAYYGMDIDKDNNIYVATTRRYMNQLMVYKYNGTSWNTIGENITLGEAYNARIAVDNNGKVYVLCRDAIKKNRPTVWTYNGGNWETVGPRGFYKGEVYFGEIITDVNNMPIISFMDYEADRKPTILSYGVFTAIEEGNNTMATEVETYPNPATDQIQIDLKNINKGSYTISDLSGREIDKGEFHTDNLQINIADFTSGMYMINIRAENQQWYSRFTKE
jgi:hypothetical protein